MTEYFEQIMHLMGEAEGLRDGDAKVAIVEQAVAIADSHNDLELAFETRKYMLGACLEAGNYELMLVTFTWCLGQHDRDPERFAAHRILFEFRWVVSSLTSFPQVTRKKIKEMQAEMHRRYRRAGASLRSYWLMCRYMALDIGDGAAASAADRQWRKSPDDWLTDGEDTEQGFEITYRLFRRDYDKALAAAKPFISQKMRSDHFEGQACADVLLPMLRRGQARQAMPLHKRGYKLRADKPRHLESLAHHIAFLALTNNLPRAVKLFERHLADAFATANEFNRMRFLIGTLPLVDRLMLSGRKQVRLRLPEQCPAASDSGRVDVRALSAWMRATARDLAERFDRRNGNRYFARQLGAARRLQRLFSPCPYKP